MLLRRLGCRCSTFAAFVALAALAAAALPCGGPALAQTPGGRITGVVRDARGVPREAATVTVTNNATGASRRTATAASGTYAVARPASGP